MTFDASLLQRLAAAFQVTAAEGRERVEVGPFAVWLHPSSDDPLHSVAAPVRTCGDWPSAIVELGAAFAARGRTPRVEHFAELVPGLARALEGGGIPCDMRAPVMTLDAARFEPADCRAGSIYARLDPGEANRVEGFLDMQCEAFGMERDRLASWKPLFLAGLRSGALHAGVETVDGVVVSGATIQDAGRVGELAGVGTRSALQGRGHASAACSHLLRAWFAGGGEVCWLSAGEGAQGLYTRLGFEMVGTQLNHGAAHPA